MKTIKAITFLFYSISFGVIGTQALAFNSLYSRQYLQVQFTDRSECLSYIQNQISYRDLSLDKRYHRLDPLSVGIKPDNQSQWLAGSNDTAIILFHGFSSSPFEVAELGKSLAGEGHYSVFLPLLEGFGSTARVANQHTYSDWRRSVSEDIALVSLCYDRIVLGGFSLGGALVTEYVLNSEKSKTTIKGLIALSPFFETGSLTLNVLETMLNPFKDTVTYRWMFNVSGNRDLKIIVQYPEYYQTELPMKSARQVIALGRAIRAKYKLANNSTPYFLGYSESDSVINSEKVAKVYQTNFMGINKQISYPKELGIAHQITRPEVNSLVSDLNEEILRFLHPL